MRKITKVFLSLVCALSLTGCHGTQKTNAFEAPVDFDESQTQEITFWAKNDTNKKQTRIYKQAIEDFEKLYPNIKVTLRLYTDYNKIYNDVITNISTGTTPDVCITYPDHIATYLSGQNVVVPLDDLMDNPEYGLGGAKVKFESVQEDEIISQFLDEGKLGGTQYALPFMRSTEAVYVNKTYVEKLGYELPEKLTWDFIFEVSEKAMEKNPDGTYKVNGQKVMIPFIYKSTDNMMIQMLKQKGAGYSDESGEIRLFSEDTKEILKEIAAYTESGAFSTFKISGYPANFLNAGQCIFAIDSTAGSTWMGSDAPLVDISEDALQQFETAVLEVPQYDWNNPQMISQGPSVCIFNKEDPQRVMASWLFAQYLLTNDVQIAYAETEGYVPVTSKAQNSAEYQTYLSEAGKDNDTYYDVKIQASELLLANVGDTFTTPVFNGSASLRQAAGTLIEDVTKAVRRKKTVDDAFIEEEYKSVSGLYRLDQISGGIEGSKRNLGPLPHTAKVLLGALVLAWVGIAMYAMRMRFFKNRKNRV